MKKQFNGHANKGGIYKITNTKNNKVYIGSAKCFKKRAYQHSSRLKKGKHHNKHLLFSFNKWGEINFLFEVLEVIDGDRLARTIIEQKYINKYLDNWEQCYNLIKKTVCKQGPWSKKPEVTKEKLSKIRKGKTYEQIFGIGPAQQIKAKQSKTHKKRFVDNPKLAQNMSIRMTGENNLFYGKTHSEKVKDLISRKQKGSLEERFGKDKANLIKKKLSKKRQEMLKEFPEKKETLGNFIRGRTLEEIYGTKRAQKIKLKRSKGIAKTYKGFYLLAPDGNVYVEITNMLQFCKKHKLANTHMCKLIAGKLQSHKGWKLLSTKS